jgi:predicted nucleic acid-binding protein
VFESDQSPRCVSPFTVADEVAEHLPAVVAKAKVNPSLALLALRAMPVDWQPPEVYEPFREEALERIGARDPDDWPVVALALALGLPVWSQDKDFDDTGLTVYTTGDLLDALRDEEVGPA